MMNAGSADREFGELDIVEGDVQTVDASRLMGAGVIITGLSSEIAQTLVTIGVDLSGMKTVGDLQGGIEEAEHLLGFKVVRMDDAEH